MCSELRDAISVLPEQMQDGLVTAEDCAEALSNYVLDLQKRLALLESKSNVASEDK